MATIGGARCLGRADEIGSLEPGKLADLALWRMDGLGHVGIADPVDRAGDRLGPAAGTAHGRRRGGGRARRLVTADEEKLAADLRRACEEVRAA